MRANFARWAPRRSRSRTRASGSRRWLAAHPEQKRLVIGEKFVEVQERILESENYLDGHWILGQGTIYPDTIESGGSAKADLIKTHHNRVAGIQKLIDEGRILEPLSSFYKDEGRAIGRQLGLAPDLLIAILSLAPAWPFAASAPKPAASPNVWRKAGSCPFVRSAYRATRARTGPCWRSKSFLPPKKQPRN